MSRYEIPAGWKEFLECRKCGHNFEPDHDIARAVVCPNCGSEKIQALKPKSEYMPLGKCPNCGHDLYAYRKKTDLNISYIPVFMKSVISCKYCQTILGITEKAPVPFLWEIIRPIA